MQTFCPPVVIESPALVPKAVLYCPVVVAAKELSPTATLEDPVVFAFNASLPTATRLLPVVVCSPAFPPINVPPPVVKAAPAE